MTVVLSSKKWAARQSSDGGREFSGSQGETREWSPCPGVRLGSAGAYSPSRSRPGSEQ